MCTEKELLAPEETVKIATEHLSSPKVEVLTADVVCALNHVLRSVVHEDMVEVASAVQLALRQLGVHDTCVVEVCEYCDYINHRVRVRYIPGGKGKC